MAPAVTTSGTKAHLSHQVLIVDDDDDVRETLAQALKAAGMTARTAWSGEDALRHFRQGFRPCVMILDLRMPGMDGWELWDRMRIDPELSRIPVIMVSGHPEEERFAKERGVAEFFEKPALLNALVGSILRHCRSPS